MTVLYCIAQSRLSDILSHDSALCNIVQSHGSALFNIAQNIDSPYATYW
jgi:hypothetical protein